MTRKVCRICGSAYSEARADHVRQLSHRRALDARSGRAPRCEEKVRHEGDDRWWTCQNRAVRTVDFGTFSERMCLGCASVYAGDPTITITQETPRMTHLDESGGFIDWATPPATTAIVVGSRVLLIYPAGDADWVEVTALRSYEEVEVRLANGTVLTTVMEDIGIGVDDDLTATFADGTTWPPSAPDHAHSGPCGECETWDMTGSA